MGTSFTDDTGNEVYQSGFTGDEIDKRLAKAFTALQPEDTDKSLMLPNAAADAKATGDAIRALEARLDKAFTWIQIQNYVRSGLGQLLFPAGYEFETLDSDTGNTLVWVVCDHNKHKAADSSLTHSMTIRLKNLYSNTNGNYVNLMFNAAEALYYCNETLSAGTYNVTWEHATNAVLKGTYQFTLTQEVPAGGQIVISGSGNASAITDRTIETYASVGTATAIERGLAITTGSEGIGLGTLNAATSTDDNLNCGQRILFGSNNYAQSAVRQWLNSAADAGSVWSPANKFDRPPVWADTYDGFMHGLPAEFLAAVQPAAIPCRTNSVFEVESLDGTKFEPNQVYTVTDKFFLLSRPEMYGTWDSADYKDGVQLELFEGLTNTERIERDVAGSAHYTWLRSPNPTHASSECIVNLDGSLYNGNSISAHGVSPACIIA